MSNKKTIINGEEHVLVNSSWQTPSNASVIEQCIKDAGLNPVNDYVSMEHFMCRAKLFLSLSEDAYYKGDEDQCAKDLDEAIKILQAAKVFNQNYGL